MVTGVGTLENSTMNEPTGRDPESPHAGTASSGGTLYVVATPIGNMRDITLRALEVLRSVDLVLAEDTRRTRALLSRHGIAAGLLSVHEHNERARVTHVTQRLEQGEDLALVTDAGTPLISDPGYVLVRALTQKGLRVVPVPGPSALLAALSVAGLPTDRFVFEGFLAARGPARRQHLQTLRSESRTIVFYESPRRLAAMLEDAAEILGGEREATIARELTKIHESTYIGTLAELSRRVVAGTMPARGEIVVCIAGDVSAAEVRGSADLEPLLRALLAEMPVRQAVRIVCHATGSKRNTVYELALALKSTDA